MNEEDDGRVVDDITMSSLRADKAREQLLLGHAKVSRSAVHKYVTKLRRSDDDMRRRSIDVQQHLRDRSAEEEGSIDPSIEAERTERLNLVGVAEDKTPLTWSDTSRQPCGGRRSGETAEVGCSIVQSIG